MKKLLCAAALAWTSLVTAQPITFITTSAVGSLSDTALRQILPAIERELGRPAVIVNAPGANGLLALHRFLDTPHAVLVGNTSLSYLRMTGYPVPYLVPLAGLAQTNMAVYSGKHHSLGDLKKSGTLFAGSTTPMTDMSIALFDEALGVQTKVAGYKVMGQAVVDLVAGRLDYLIAPEGSAALQPMTDAGHLSLVQNLGPQFTWSGFFGKEYNPALSIRLQKVVSQARFDGVRPLNASPTDLEFIQLSEMAQIKKAQALLGLP